MTEQQQQFRVGLFVIVATVLAGLMVFQFGELRRLWEPTYAVAIHFDAAPGVQPGTPVRRNGISIGRVREVVAQEAKAGVSVVVEVRQPHRLRVDAQPRIVRSLLGDSGIEIAPGRQAEFLEPGAVLAGEAAVDPIEIVNQLERQVSATLVSFRETSQEWQRVADNLNLLMDTNRGSFDTVLEQTAEALAQFTLTMRRANTALAHANQILADPAQQQNLKQTLEALPQLVDETRQTIHAVRDVVGEVDRNLSHLNDVTEPLARQGRSMAARLDATLGNMQTVSAELSAFSRALNREDGSLQQLLGEPDLYRNLDRSAASLAVLLENLQPIVRDLRIFSDKIARHPELIGVRGALRGSSGLKEPELRNADGPLPTPVERR